MLHPLARLARHRVWPDSHTFRIRARFALQGLLVGTGLALAVFADAAPATRGLPVAAGPVSDVAVVVLTLLALFGLAQLRGARLLRWPEVARLQEQAQLHPEAARIVATWLELDLPLRRRDQRAVARALASLRARGR